jgi:PKD repeat protein
MAYTVAGNAVVNGVPLVAGSSVEVWAYDGVGRKSLIATVLTTGSLGAFTATVPDNVRSYRCLYDGGSVRSISVLATPPGTAPPPIIIVIAGQSNALGRQDTDNITPQATQDLLETPFPAALLKQKLAQTTSDPIVWDADYPNTVMQPRADAAENMGTELSMARYLDRAAPYQFRFLKFALGSSGLDANWRPGVVFPTAGPNLFSQFITIMGDAVTEFGGAIGCIVWIQGETDAITTGPASAYESNFTTFIANVRSTYPNVPFVFNRLSSSNTGTFVGTVRTAQTDVDANVALTSMVDCDDLTLTDGQHFNANGYVTLGERLGLAVLGQLGISAPPTAAFTSIVTVLSVAFTDTSTDPDGTIVARYWDFGDGATSTATNPTRAYAINGTYTVTLTVMDGAGRSNTTSAVVQTNSPGWTLDATSSKGVPASTNEWRAVVADLALGVQVPDSIWLMQEAAGNLADSGPSAFTLTANAAPLYNQVVAGWTRTAVGTADAVANQRFRNTSASLPDIGSSSIMVLCYLAVTNNPAAARGVMAVGLASQVEMRAATSGGASALPRLQGGGQTATSLVEQGATVKPFVLAFNRTALQQTLYSDTERLPLTFGSGAQAGKLVEFGATAGASPATSRYLYAAAWYGTKAEFTTAQIKALLQALGWTVTGY